MEPNHYKSQVHEILHHPNAMVEMENFIANLSKQGWSKKDIYQMLLNIHAEMEDNQAYNILSDTLDRFVGWTTEDDQILPEENI